MKFNKFRIGHMCKIHYTPVWLERRDNSFHIQMDILFICDGVGEDASYVCTPMLVSDSHHLELPSVLLAGRRRYRAFRWMMWGSLHKTLGSYRIRKILKAGGSSLYYRYDTSITYEDWMSEAQIRLLSN